jgi:DNA ligase-1
VFDQTNDETLLKPFIERLEIVKERVLKLNDPSIWFVEHDLVENYDELLEYEQKYLLMGYEGLMMRTPGGIYKCNRATYRDQIIYKLKRFTDAEGKIVGFEEGNTNTNVQERDERGYAKRSSSKDGLVAAGTLGKILVGFEGNVLKVAPGAFTHHQRKAIWDCQDAVLGKWLKFRYFSIGVKDLPRFSRAVGFRDEMDM